MRLSALLMALLMLSACGHFLEPSAHHAAYLAQQKQLAAAANASGKICKRMMVTGSNMPKRVCSTAEEWAAYDKARQTETDQFNQDRRQGGTPTDGESGPRPAM